MAKSKIENFKRTVWRYYRAHGRHTLPWRKTHTPYKILVSEIMLQQTQVERVIPFYKKFVKKFPTAKKLAAAPLSEVLKSWQGLGYNRRAKMLHDAAKTMVLKYDATFPVDYRELVALPGVGPYTARAVTTFARNEDGIFIETNIRTAIIHSFFPNKKKVEDEKIEKILAQTLPKGKSREWYSALMDYGAHLKRSGIKLNPKQTAYHKQKKFIGSVREARGAILRALAGGERTQAHLVRLFDASRRAQVRHALAALQAEGLITKTGSKYFLPM